MICSKCDRKMHARGLCASHYTAWYREHAKECKREKPYHVRKWKFTPAHWWKWWEARTPSQRDIERATHIEQMRQSLP